MLQIQRSDSCMSEIGPMPQVQRGIGRSNSVMSAPIHSAVTPVANRRGHAVVPLAIPRASNVIDAETNQSVAQESGNSSQQQRGDKRKLSITPAQTPTTPMPPPSKLQAIVRSFFEEWAEEMTLGNVFNDTTFLNRNLILWPNTAAQQWQNAPGNNMRNDVCNELKGFDMQNGLSVNQREQARRFATDIYRRFSLSQLWANDYEIPAVIYENARREAYDGVMAWKIPIPLGNTSTFPGKGGMEIRYEYLA